MAGKLFEDFKKEMGEANDGEENLGPCASRATPKWWPGFHVKNAKLIPEGTPTTRSFDYSHMGYREYDPGNTFFVIEINEPEKWRIRVEGRALWKIYNYLHLHRLEWIEPAVGRSAMAVPDGVPVIERITIQRIEEKADHVATGRTEPE
jgi:hypothetical protein